MARHPVPDLLPGTLDLLILRTLQTGPQHGWAISHHIRATSGEALQVNQGALYPAIYRLEAQGLLKASEGLAEKYRKLEELDGKVKAAENNLSNLVGNASQARRAMVAAVAAYDKEVSL